MCSVCIACGISAMFCGGGGGGDNRVRELSVAAFVFALHYAFLPASMLFMIVCGIGANTWSVKGLAFMLNGSLSIHGLPLPDALLASGSEVVLGIALTIIQGGVTAMYMYYVSKDNRRRQWMLAYDPNDMTIGQSPGPPEDDDLQFDFNGHELDEAPIDL
jgi:hypothetical protein